MAALSERDKKVILGDNYKQILEGSDSSARVRDPRKWARDKVVATEGQRMTAVTGVVIGLALLLSTYLTTKGETFWIQGAAAIAFLVAGVIGIVYAQVKLREYRPLSEA